MSWFNVWDGLKSKVCRYLLQRYLGQFIDGELNIEKLKVDLFNGKASVQDVDLKVEVLNDIFQKQGWAIEVLSGKIGVLTVIVPWNTLTTNDSDIEVSNISLVIRPIKLENFGTSMLESMWSSVSSSIQLAEECMNQNHDGTAKYFETYPNTIVGLEKFAETIDNVLNRISARIENVSIKLECIHSISQGVSLILRIKKCVYKNDTYKVVDHHYYNTKLDHTCPAQTKKSEFQNLPLFAKHNFILEGISLSTEEFTYKIESQMDLFHKSNSVDCYKAFTKHFVKKINTLEIPVFEMKNEQLIKVKLKQSEEIDGPKILLDVEFGSLSVIVNPRQLHLLSVVTQSFNEDKDIRILRRKTNTYFSCNVDSSYPNEDSMNTSYMGGELSNFKSWSNDKNSVHSLEYRPSESISDYQNSDSIASDSSNTTTAYKQSYAGSTACGSISKITMKVLSVFVVILHEDFLEENFIFDTVTQERIDQRYIKILKAIDTILENQELIDLKLKDENYFQIQFSRLHITGAQERNLDDLLSKFSISITQVEFFEVLNLNTISLISFHRKKNISREPNFTLNVTTSHSRKLKKKMANFEILVDNCTIELDITMYDRISAIVGKSPFQVQRNSTNTFGNQHHTKWTLASSNIDFKLRFPIVNIKDKYTAHEKCWLKRHIQKDFLLISLRGVQFHNELNEWSITGANLEIYYCEDDSTRKIMLLKSTSDQNPPSQFLNKPIINITFDKICEKENRTKLMQSNLPFCSQHGYRQSNISQLEVTNQDTEFLILPGEREEIKHFCDFSKETSKIQVSARFPYLIAALRSKKLFDVIYNRIIFDLMMWEPTSPYFHEIIESPSNHNTKSFYKNIDMDSTLTTSFSRAQTVLLSSYTENSPNKINPFLECKTSNDILEDCNTFSLEVIVEKGHLILFTPTKHENEKITYDTNGRFDIKIQDLKFFNVIGFRRKRNLEFFCFQLKDLDVFHNGLNQTVEDIDENTNSKINDNMQSVLYKTPPGLTKANSTGNSKRDMISLIIEMRKNDQQKLKRLKLTSFIQMITFRHRCTMSKSNWISQLIDFFNIQEFPSTGYEPYSVITETQLHFLDCAIDYRCVDFPFRSIMEFGSLCLSSNIISDLKSCNWHFTLEESVLSIAPYNNVNNVENCANFEKSFIKSDDLVPLIDIGVIEISLKLSDEIDIMKSPEVDLRCSINDAHLRTCFDSLTALSKLLVHVAHKNNKKTPEVKVNLQAKCSKTTTTVKSITNFQQEHLNIMMAEAIQDTVKSYNQCIDNASKVDVFCFPDETLRHEPICALTHQKKLTHNKSDKIDPLSTNILSDNIHPEVKSDLGDTQFSRYRSINEHKHYEDEYCFVSQEDEMTNYGIDNLNVNDESFGIVDNHFSVPKKKSDELNIPDGFPMAKTKYTLCDMTLTWHIYGGRDFVSKVDDYSEINVKTEIPQMSDAYQNGIWSTKSLNLIRKQKEKLTWKTKGGCKRDYEYLVEMQFTKVRLTHEMYPPNTIFASRQILIVHDIEIRDRVQSSDINKLLYNPNAKHTKLSDNMITVKALHSPVNIQNPQIQECSLKMSLMPLRLHIDQDTLLFLVDFFSAIGKNEIQGNEDKEYLECVNNNPPLITVDKVPEHIDSLLKVDQQTTEVQFGESSFNESISPALFFREVIFSPEVSICFDYQGRRIELSRGPITGLIMGLGQLEYSEIRLAKLINRRGILGIEKLFTYMCREWLKDIKRNQLPKILSGIGPTYAFVQLFQGIYDLFWLPLEQFQKDGRIIKGFQLGAHSFTARTAVAALELTSRLIYLLQFTAETAFDLVSPGPSIRKSEDDARVKKKRSNRPKDIREGINNAYIILKEGINNSANTLIENTVAEHDQKGYTGAVGAVVRQIPQLVICPAVLATQATTNILGGVKNSFVPEAKMEAAEKWKSMNE